MTKITHSSISTNSAVRAAIESVFRHLPLLEGSDQLLGAAVSMLCSIDGTGSGAMPPKFSEISRRRTKQELRRLADPGNDLQVCLDALHQPAILALANCGYIRDEKISPAGIRAAAKRATESDLSWVPERMLGGRPKNQRAHAITTLLAYYYEMLTGRKPTRSVDPYKAGNPAYGPFIDFVREIFEILQLPVNVEDITRAAIRKRAGIEK